MVGIGSQGSIVISTDKETGQAELSNPIAGLLAVPPLPGPLSICCYNSMCTYR